MVRPCKLVIINPVEWRGVKPEFASYKAGLWILVGLFLLLLPPLFKLPEAFLTLSLELSLLALALLTAFYDFLDSRP